VGRQYRSSAPAAAEGSLGQAKGLQAVGGVLSHLQPRSSPPTATPETAAGGKAAFHQPMPLQKYQSAARQRRERGGETLE